MSTVTVFTAERMQEIEDTTIVGGSVDVSSGHLLLSPRVGVSIDAGNVKGDTGLTGPTGPAGSTGIPAGTVAVWPGDTAPTNWMICDGAAVSRTTYASLFAAIGTKYGAGDGSTTFNLPNLKGKTPTGLDTAQTEFNALAKTGGEKTHTLTSTEMPSHTHVQNSHSHAWANGGTNVPNDGATGISWFAASGSTYGWRGAALLGAIAVNQNTGGGAAHNVLSPYLTVSFIIKVTNGDTPDDSQLTGRVSVLESGTAPSQLIAQKTRLAQRSFNGGGIRKVTQDTVAWTQNFRTMGIGTTSLSPGGYFNIAMPPNGTVIPVIGNASVISITVASGVINMGSGLSGYSALFYDLPIGQIYTPDPTRFHIVDYLATTIEIPSTWVLVVLREGDSNVPGWMWGDGRAQDFWKDLTLVNGWTNFGAPYANFGWKFTDSGEIELRGLVANGGVTTIIGSLGAALAPLARATFVQGAAVGLARIDITNTNGDVFVNNYIAGGTNGSVSLEGIHWTPQS